MGFAQRLETRFFMGASEDGDAYNDNAGSTGALRILRANLGSTAYPGADFDNSGVLG